MASAADLKKAYEEWKEHCKNVQSMTQLSLKTSKETPVQKDKRIKYLLSHYDAFCEYYFPHYLTIKDKVTGAVVRIAHNAPFHSRRPS